MDADVSYKLNETKKQVYVYFLKHGSLGAGGTKIPWKDISKNKPIAVIDASKAVAEDTIAVTWLGFLNQKTGEIYDFGKEDIDGTYQKQNDGE